MIKTIDDVILAIKNRRPWNKKVTDEQISRFLKTQDQRIKDLEEYVIKIEQSLSELSQNTRNNNQSLTELAGEIKRLDNLEENTRNNNQSLTELAGEIKRLDNLEENTRNNNQSLTELAGEIKRLDNLEENTRNNNQSLTELAGEIKRLDNLEENTRNNNQSLTELAGEIKRLDNLEENTRNNNQSLTELAGEIKRLDNLEENTRNNNQSLTELAGEIKRLDNLEENTRNNNQFLTELAGEIKRLDNLEENTRNNNQSLTELAGEIKRLDNLEENTRNNNQSLTELAGEIKRLDNLEENTRNNNQSLTELTGEIKRLDNLEENTRNNNQSLTELAGEINKLENLEGQVAEYLRYSVKLKCKLDDIEKYFKDFNIISSNCNNSCQDEFKVELTSSIREKDTYFNIDYFDFENHFRDSRDKIKEVLLQYVKYFKDRKKVLDLGCGRGEFLELLTENQIGAIGIDTYREFVEYCKMHHFNVVEEDCIEFLKTIDSTDGIFAGQLVEHLEMDQIIALCNIAYEKLERGAYLIIETPNPTSLAIYTHAFYIDPSHVKPVHPLTLQYFLQKAGFCEINILYTENSKLPVSIPKLECSQIVNAEAFNECMKIVEDTLFGSQDYAIIAKK